MLIPVAPFDQFPRDREADRRAVVDGPWWLAPLSGPRAIALPGGPMGEDDICVLIDIVRERDTHVLGCADPGLVTTLLDEGALSVAVGADVVARLEGDIPADRIGFFSGTDENPPTDFCGTVWTRKNLTSDVDKSGHVRILDAGSGDISALASHSGTVALWDAHRTAADFEASYFSAKMAGDDDAPLFTILCDEIGRAVGWGWSRRESIRRSMHERRVFLSVEPALPMGALSSGLTEVQADLSGRVIRYCVGRCASDLAQWPNRWIDREGFTGLFERLRERVIDSLPGSYTRRLLDSPEMLRGKLIEEAGELAAAANAADVRMEAADVLYFAWVSLARADVNPGEVERELERRTRRMNRRPGNLKPSGK